MVLTGIGIYDFLTQFKLFKYAKNNQEAVT